jgi:hypothetical protein
MFSLYVVSTLLPSFFWTYSRPLLWAWDRAGSCAREDEGEHPQEQQAERESTSLHVSLPTGLYGPDSPW